jgi:putative FmdB family regulatory protein
MEGSVPTYSYACTECDNRFDVVQAFTEDTLTTCENCSGRLRKLFGSVGVVFKGSGFYRTDSRDSTANSSNGSTKNGQKSDSGKNGETSDSGKSTESSGSTEKTTTPTKTSSSSSSSASTGSQPSSTAAAN